MRLDHLLEGGLRHPSELLARLGGVADQVLDLSRAQEARIEAHVLVGIDPGVLEGDAHQVAHRVRGAGGDHIVLGLVLLEHQPHGLDVVPGIAPVALGVEVAERHLLGEAELDGGGGVGDLAGDELEPATLRFVIEKYP